MAENPFKRLIVTFAPLGGTRIEWELGDRFKDPFPHVFQLQTTNTSVNQSDTWENVGSSVEDTYYVIDDSQRIFSKSWETHYRIRLESPIDIYYSPLVNGITAEQYRDWRIHRKLNQQEKKRHRYVSVEGYILKERRYGPQCTVCLDTLSKIPKKSRCTSCFGVGFDKGYFSASDEVYCELGLEQALESQNIANAGTQKLPSSVSARFLSAPQLNSRDIFVERRSGRRWRIEAVASTAEIRATKLVTQVTMNLLPINEIIYQVPL